MDLILTKQTEKLFKDGSYVESAMHFAKSRCSFEDVTVRLLKTALKNDLKKKLETLRNSEKTQITLIVVWLVEIYQIELGRLREDKESGREAVESLQEELLALLKQPQVAECLKHNIETIYNRLRSHGDQDSLGAVAGALGDTQRLVSYSLAGGEYGRALRLLQSAGEPSLWYSHAPTLLSASPEECVNSLLMLPPSLLSPEKLLPALLTASQAGAGAQVIR